ncbi:MULTISPECIES: hypothetical protein [Chryseobacterium]|uniref:hypothetical protein n=1 Tax=Chryseobacterium sp. R2A-55 TaxID=2744445 RepID=UPI001F20C723|nr:hypothetical protein [Chryseobacterium sp. R2A-55]
MKKPTYPIFAGILIVLISCQKSEPIGSVPALADSNTVVVDSAATNHVKYPENIVDYAIRKPVELNETDLHTDNSLPTGATPYSKYYGENSSCKDYGCSQIDVKTPNNSDVLVLIKRNDKVVRHAYIQAGDRYIFSFPNGNYQAFFYYGKDWDPEKEMKNGKIKGGFLTDENFGKDEKQSLYNNVLTYELIAQPNGNFSTKPSNPEEAL